MQETHNTEPSSGQKASRGLLCFWQFDVRVGRGQETGCSCLSESI